MSHSVSPCTNDPCSKTYGLQIQSFDTESEHQAPELTFGVEFEYVYICLEDDIPPREWNSYGRSVVRGVLSQTLRAKCSTCGDRIPFKLPLFRESRLNINDKDFSHWDVGPEALCIPTEEEELLGADREKYAFLSVEISSRVLQATKALQIPAECGDHIHQISWEEEISAVLSKLRREFCTFDDQGKRDYLFNSDVCGFHVHVGNFDNGFDLQTVKNVQCLDIACERLIDQVHAKQRINGTDLALRPLRWCTHVDNSARAHCMDAATYNSPSSEKFLTRTYWARYRNLNSDDDDESVLRAMQRRVWERSVYPESKIDRKPGLSEAWGRNDIDSWMQVVQLADDIKDLSHLAAPRTKASNVSIYHLLPKAMGHCKRTIEFRQHASTLQTAPVLAWIDFVVRFVDWCQSRSWDSLKPYISKNGTLRTAESSFLDLCHLLGCSPRTSDHYARVLSGLDGDYARHVRELEHDQIRRYESPDEPLAHFALSSIELERRNLCMRNVQRRIRQKLVFGGKHGLFKDISRVHSNISILIGYGQFSRDFLDALAITIESVAAERYTLDRITLGFESPAFPTPDYGYAQCVFRDSEVESTPSATDSRWSRSSSLERPSTPIVWPRELLSSVSASPELAPMLAEQHPRGLASLPMIRTLRMRRLSSPPDLVARSGFLPEAIAES